MITNFHGDTNPDVMIFNSDFNDDEPTVPEGLLVKPYALFKGDDASSEEWAL